MKAKKRNATWIKVYRGIMNSSVWDDDKRFKAWMYILLETTYHKRSKYYRGSRIQLERGDCFLTIRTMAKAIGCEPKTIKKILSEFEQDGMIVQKSVPYRYTVLKVVKYEMFQGEKIPEDYAEDYTEDYTEDHTDNHTEDYTEDHADDHADSPHHKKDKKDKKDQESIPPSPWTGGADEYGPAPDGWDDEWEKDFMEDAWQNPGCTRAEWYEDWKDWTGKG